MHPNLTPIQTFVYLVFLLSWLQRLMDKTPFVLLYDFLYCTSCTVILFQPFCWAGKCVTLITATYCTLTVHTDLQPNPTHPPVH
jgi:hypothetical protein